MPTSNLALALEVLAMVDQVPHATVLDVGPGHGKYAVLLREYLTESPGWIAAVEACDGYVGDFRLRSLYDVVFVGDVLDRSWLVDHDDHDDLAIAASVLEGLDVVLMVDVIEHIEKQAALDLLRRIPGRVVICTPVDWFDNDPDGRWPHWEQHVSHWSETDWTEAATGHSVEVAYTSLGGWLVRLGPRI